MCQFSVKINNFEFFGLNLVKLLNTCDIKVRKCAGWRWVELGASLVVHNFKNTFQMNQLLLFQMLQLLGKVWHHRCYFQNRNHISAICKKDCKRDIANYRPITILNFTFKLLATIIGEHQSEDIKNRIILLLLYSQVSNRCPPAYRFLENLRPRTVLFHTPCLLNFKKCSSQDVFKSRQ